MSQLPPITHIIGILYNRLGNMNELNRSVDGNDGVSINRNLSEPRYLEQNFTHFDVVGVSVGTGGTLGEDALHSHKTDSGVRIAMVDAISFDRRDDDSSYLSTGRVHAEVVASCLAKHDSVPTALDAAKSELTAINEQRELKGQELVKSDPPHFPFGVIELSTSHKGQVYFKPTVQADISMMAWFPGLAKRIIGGNARVVYFEPGMNRRIVYQSPPIPVPKGTLIIAASDGGIRALFKPSVLKAGGFVLSAADHEELEKTAISIDTITNIPVAKRDFNRLARRLLGLLHDSDTSIRKMAQAIAVGDTGDDDATIVFCRVKK